MVQPVRVVVPLYEQATAVKCHRPVPVIVQSVGVSIAE